MAIFNGQEPIVLLADRIDEGLIFALEKEYLVIVSREEKKIKIELYNN